jgi:GNAT superfamily N-acetyltransferase
MTQPGETGLVFNLRPTAPTDLNWVRNFIRTRWSAEFVVAHGMKFHPDQLPGFVVESCQGAYIGLATYIINEPDCELVTLDSLQPGQGIGTALVQAVAREASRYGCSRLWCITTNDNLPALAFYQKRGFRIIAVHPGAVERSRLLKPSIPLLGFAGIPIRDELELELPLPSSPEG